MEYQIEKQFLIALLQLPRVKRKTVNKIIKNLDRDIFTTADLIEFIAKHGNTKILSAISVGDVYAAVNKAHYILNTSMGYGIEMVSILDKNYPVLLKACDDPPIILNYLGNFDLLTSMPTICIAGTRTPSNFGKSFSNHVGDFFGSRGFNIISGLAQGCDTAAHLGALASNGVTSAILAHGLDTVYPKENSSLAERIKENGVLVTEYFVGTKMAGKHFIDRDRIQAALSLGTLIIECDVNSGTMHTANYTFEYKRILTCMKPPLEHQIDAKIEGNMNLTRAGKAIGVYYDTELDELATAIRVLH